MVDVDRAVRQFERKLPKAFYGGESGTSRNQYPNQQPGDGGWELIATIVYDPLNETVKYVRAGHLEQEIEKKE